MNLEDRLQLSMYYNNVIEESMLSRNMQNLLKTLKKIAQTDIRKLLNGHIEESIVLEAAQKLEYEIEAVQIANHTPYKIFRITITKQGGEAIEFCLAGAQPRGKPKFTKASAESIAKQLLHAILTNNQTKINELTEKHAIEANERDTIAKVIQKANETTKEEDGDLEKKLQAGLSSVLDGGELKKAILILHRMMKEYSEEQIIKLLRKAQEEEGFDNMMHRVLQGMARARSSV